MSRIEVTGTVKYTFEDEYLELLGLDVTTPEGVTAAIEECVHDAMETVDKDSGGMEWTGKVVERFTVDRLEVETFARDLFGTDTTVGIRDDGELLVYCHEQMAQKVIEALEGVL